VRVRVRVRVPEQAREPGLGPAQDSVLARVPGSVRGQVLAQERALGQEPVRETRRP